MRKLLLASFCIALFSSVTNAQVITKGQKIIGGSIAFSSGKDESQLNADYKQTNLELAPSYAKAIKDNLLAGASINFSKYKQNQTYTSFSDIANAKGSGIGAELFLEKFHPLVNNFSISAKGALQAGHSSYEYERLYNTETSTMKRNAGYTNIILAPSINYFFSKRLMAQFYLNDFVALRYEKGEVTDVKQMSKKTKNYDNLSFSSILNTGETLGYINFSFRYLLQ